jgi:hypothetical protein
MTARYVLSTAVVAALVGGLSVVPAAAQPPTPPAGRPLDIYASMERAIARATAEEPVAKPAQARPKTNADKQNSNGGSSSGGGHTGLIIGLVTAAAGIGGTVYAVHQMQKTENTLTATPH